jgi:hypothetical protein
MVHAALLLLMLEAAQRGPRFTISLKRSTQNSSAINKLPADYPIFWGQSGHFVLELSISTSDQLRHGRLKTFTAQKHCSLLR